MMSPHSRTGEGTASFEFGAVGWSSAEDGEVRIGVLVLRYVQERKNRNEITGKTPKGYSESLWLFVQFVGPDRDSHRITRSHVERWLAGMDVAASTLRTRLSAVRTFCEWCVEHRYMKKNPTDGIGRIKVPEPVPRALRPEQIADVLAACPDRRAKVIVLLECQEMLRRAEVAAVQLGDINVKERLVRVRGKGGKQRVVPLSDETLLAIRAYLLEQPAKAGPLIRNYLGTKGIAPEQVGVIVRDVMRTAGVAETGHALRHTGATDVLKMGANIRAVQKALGHASLGTTQRYLGWDVSDLRKALQGRRYAAGRAKIVDDAS